MSTAPTRLLSPRQYLAQERAATFRSEYYSGETLPRPRANWAHTLIKDNLAGEAGNQLENGPCRVVTSDLRVKISATAAYTYPDVVIVCDEPQFEDDCFDTLLNPRAIAEVLSESTEKYDRGTKFEHYRQLPSLQVYVLVSQDRPLVERYVRQPDDSWLLTAISDLTQSFAFGAVPVQIALAEIYRGVKFPEAHLRPSPSHE